MRYLFILLLFACNATPRCDQASAKRFAEGKAAGMVQDQGPHFSDTTDTYITQRGDTFVVEGWMDTTGTWGATGRSEYHVECICDSGQFELVRSWLDPGPAPFDHSF